MRFEIYRPTFPYWYVYPQPWYYHLLCISETQYQFCDVNINYKLVYASDMLENSSPGILIMWIFRRGRSVDAKHVYNAKAAYHSVGKNFYIRTARFQQ
jgi:hypothetical protein